MKKFLLCILIFSSVIFNSTGCSKEQLDKIERDTFALDTHIKLTVYGEEKATNKAIDEAIRRMKEIENTMSISIKDSDVNQINEKAGIEPVKVHDDTFYVIKRALYYSELTNGAFDITIHPLVKLWDIKAANPRVPKHEEIQKVLPLINYKKVIVNDNEQTVFLQDKGMMID